VRAAARLILPAAALAAAVVAVVLLPHSPGGLRALVLEAGPLAPLLALAAWALLVPALFPGTVLAAAGGLAFGAVGGAALAVAGALAGGLSAFALGRTAAGAPVHRLVAGRPRLVRLLALLEHRGFGAVLAARLTPGVPAGWLHYAAAVSPVRLRAFAAAMAAGAILRTAPYAIIGDGLASGSASSLAVAAATTAVGGLGAALLTRSLWQQR